MAIPRHMVAILSAAPWVKLHQGVAKKREVHGLKASIHCSRLIWTKCDYQHGQPALFNVATTCYFIQWVGGSLGM